MYTVIGSSFGICSLVSYCVISFMKPASSLFTCNLSYSTNTAENTLKNMGEYSTLIYYLSAIGCQTFGHFLTHTHKRNFLHFIHLQRIIYKYIPQPLFYSHGSLCWVNGKQMGLHMLNNTFLCFLLVLKQNSKNHLILGDNCIKL